MSVEEDFECAIFLGLLLQLLFLIGFIAAFFIWGLKYSPSKKPIQPCADAVSIDVNENDKCCPCCRNNH